MSFVLFGATAAARAVGASARRRRVADELHERAIDAKRLRLVHRICGRRDAPHVAERHQRGGRRRLVDGRIAEKTRVDFARRRHRRFGCSCERRRLRGSVKIGAAVILIVSRSRLEVDAEAHAEAASAARQATADGRRRRKFDGNADEQLKIFRRAFAKSDCCRDYKRYL